MDERTAFLNAIIAAPDDDSPRLVYADWLDETGSEPDSARAEFIRAQIELSRPTLDDQRRQKLERRAEALRRQYAKAWHPCTETLMATLRYKRGFIDEMQTATRTFINSGDLFAVEPIVSVQFLTVRNLLASFAEAAECPHLAQVRRLAFYGECGDDELAILAQSPYLRGLQSLDLTEHVITGVGLRAFAQKARIDRLAELHLGTTQVHDSDIAQLLTAPFMRHIRGLWLGGADIGDGALEVIAESSAVRHLEELDLSNLELSQSGVRTLARSTQLRKLNYLSLAESDLPSLAVRELQPTGMLAGLSILDLTDTALNPADRRWLRQVWGERVLLG